MRPWLEKVKWKIQCFMRGRHGQDRLSFHLYVAAIILIVVSAFLPYRILPALALLCMVLSIARSLSKSHIKRNKENDAYEKLLSKPVSFVNRKKRQWSERKTHKFFRCKCGTTLRVPKGKGKIEITCPKCRESMIRNT